MADRQHTKTPAAASRVTDEETGTEGASDGENLRRSLFALDAMRQRGLIDEATWAERRQALLAAADDRADPGADPNHGPGGGNRDGR